MWQHVDFSEVTVLHLRQLPVSPSQAREALLEERVNLCFLYGRGQVNGVQRAGVIVAARPRERERDHGRLLPLGQEVQEGEPHRSILEGFVQRTNVRDDERRLVG